MTEVSDHHERLGAIIGRWATSGLVSGDPPVPVTGTDIYEALPGGHFLVHHVDVTVGDQVVQAIEIIGEADPATGGYLARSFDNAGNAEVMHLTIDAAGVFHFRGGSDIAPTARPAAESIIEVRSTLTPSSDGTSMTALWERSADGHAWEPWMNISFTLIA
jgi:hypothetical protein